MLVVSCFANLSVKNRSNITNVIGLKVMYLPSNYLLRMLYSMTVTYIFKVAKLDMTVSRYMNESRKISTDLHSDVRRTIHDYFVPKIALHSACFPGEVEFGENTYRQFSRNLVD